MKFLHRIYIVNSHFLNRIFRWFHLVTCLFYRAQSNVLIEGDRYLNLISPTKKKGYKKTTNNRHEIHDTHNRIRVYFIRPQKE
jgi:hypothetical protein